MHYEFCTHSTFELGDVMFLADVLNLFCMQGGGGDLAAVSLLSVV